MKRIAELAKCSFALFDYARAMTETVPASNNAIPEPKL